MKTLLITGVSRGIGLACAKLLSSNYHIIGLSRSPLSSPIQNVTHYSCDLTNQNALFSCKAFLEKQTIDAAIFCAGKGLFQHVEEVAIKEAKELFALNFFSAAFLTKWLLPKMKRQQRSDLIFIGSVASSEAAKKNTFYGASKAALKAFTRSLRKECASSSIKVSLIEPGLCATSFYAPLDFAPKQEEGYFLDPTEVAKTVSFILETENGSVFEEISLNPQKRGIEKKRPFA
ncbi:MAG: SDR family oxidoreductase [Chlamydiota bacterium]